MGHTWGRGRGSRGVDKLVSLALDVRQGGQRIAYLINVQRFQRLSEIKSEKILQKVWSMRSNIGVNFWLNKNKGTINES